MQQTSLENSAGVGTVVIREFASGDEIAFRQLNEEWITQYFVLEEKDREALNDPHSKVLAKGGRIFFAERGGEVIGCCCLVPLGRNEFEVAKMAVTPRSQGGGVGRKLLEAVVAAGRESGARRLYLETNHQLTPAIRLYEAAGFRPVPAERVVPSPYARADVYLELWLA